MLENLDVERVIHCGDIGSAEILPLFANWPTHYVLGNVDHNVAELQTAATKHGHTLHGMQAELEWDGQRIAVTHGHRDDILNGYIHSGDWDLVCHGHTHRSRCERIGKTLVFNPGAMYRTKDHSIGVVDTRSGKTAGLHSEIIFVN
jgi:putative phosphoesterase